MAAEPADTDVTWRTKKAILFIHRTTRSHSPPAPTNPTHRHGQYLALTLRVSRPPLCRHCEEIHEFREEARLLGQQVQRRSVPLGLHLAFTAIDTAATVSSTEVIVRVAIRQWRRRRGGTCTAWDTVHTASSVTTAHKDVYWPRTPHASYPWCLPLWQVAVVPWQARPLTTTTTAQVQRQ